MSIRHSAVLLVVAVGLCGCSLSQRSQPTESAEDSVWMRTDGKRASADPVLAAQFDSDKAACTVAGGGIERACMTQRGYILVPQSQAEATAARLRAASSPN
jgi:hypothetical protein